VQLTEPRYGYETGARGVVASNRLDSFHRVLVRFEGTGHSIRVEIAALRLRDDLAD
jgi:hypothetical protein